MTWPCRKQGMSRATYRARQSKFGGLEVGDAKRLPALEDENAKLKRLLTDAMLYNVGLTNLLTKIGDARPQSVKRPRISGRRRQ